MAKARSIMSFVFPILRTDSATEKCTVPKGAVILGAEVNQTSDAVTDTGSFTVGKSGDADAYIAAFTMATTKVGQVGLGTSAGADLGVPLTADTAVTATYTAGSSTAGGEGYVILNWYMPGPGEDDNLD